MTFFLAVVACRATGETDITPIGAMGKITQLFYGVVDPANVTTNLMTAGVTAGAASSSADLLTDLKSGYLLGANPRKQFLAQFLGIFAGALVVVPAFYIIVPSANILGSDRFPAPAAQVWKGVAELLVHGLSSLHPTERWALVIGGIAGILIVLLEGCRRRHALSSPLPWGWGWPLSSRSGTSCPCSPAHWRPGSSLKGRPPAEPIHHSGGLGRDRRRESHGSVHGAQ